MKLFNLLFLVRFLVPSLLLLSFNSNAETPEEKGLTIAKQVKASDLGWKDNQVSMTMTLKNQHGETSVRQVRLKSLEQENDGDKSLSIFDSPRDVKGTAFLSFSHPVGNDDQWLYLPALKRVKRIHSRNKSGSFMGSEFSFEDLTSFEVEKYTYKFIKEEKLDNRDCFVIESYPKDKYSGYTRQVMWIDKERLYSHKIDFYDRKNALLKTLKQTGHKQYLNKFWRTERSEMVNHQNGKSTLLEWKDYKISTGLDDKDFNKNALKRAR